MFSEDDLRPISALQHLVFCERQCALIHIERAWVENCYTAEGRLLHEKVDAGGSENRGDLRIARTLALQCLRLGLVGIADAVEFHRVEAADPASAADLGAVHLSGSPGWWRPFPVEYKRGRPKSHQADEVQLCAQALCLEEMLEVSVPEGALYYGKRRRRQHVRFDRSLRALTEETTLRLHQLLDAGHTPAAVREAKCDKCSLLDICLPDAPRSSARAYLDALLSSAEGSEEDHL